MVKNTIICYTKITNFTYKKYITQSNMKEEFYNELKEYTDGQLLSGLALTVMHRIYCNDMLKEASGKYEQYKDAPELCPETIKFDYSKWKFAVKHALEIEHVYKEMLIERGIIKMGSEVA